MATTTPPKVIRAAGPRATTIRIRTIAGKYFYFFMSLLVVAVVVYGFSFTVNKNLIHPAIPRPWILYVHAVVFTSWLGFFSLQSLLVRSRHLQWHKRLGWFGAALGTLIPVIGVSTAIVMTRFDVVALHIKDAEAFLIIPFFDMVCFSATFPLAVWFRSQPELHRRLVLIATCALTAAGFGRFPESILPGYLFYAGVDILILLGVVRDLIVNRTIHRVYLTALPLIMIGQVIVTYVAFKSVPFWLRIAHALVA